MKPNTTIKNEEMMQDCISECPAGMKPIFNYAGKKPKFMMYTRGSVNAPDEQTYGNKSLPSSMR